MLRTARWLGILVGVVVAEFVLIWYVLLGPARFEHAGLAALARLGRLVPTDVVVVLPGGLRVRRVDKAGLYQRAIDLQRSEGVAAAERVYTAEFARDAGANLPSWLANQAPHSDVQAAWQVSDGQADVEVGWMTTNAFRRRGLEVADALFRIGIRDGQIASQDGMLTATSQAWLVGRRNMVDVGGWPTPAGRVGLAGLVAVLVAGCVVLVRMPVRARFGGLAVLTVLAMSTLVIFTLVDTSGSYLADLLPDPAVYRTHAVLATTAERVGDSRAAALQWAKATRHVSSTSEVTETASGLDRVAAADFPDVRMSLCTQTGLDTPWGREVLIRAGIRC